MEISVYKDNIIIPSKINHFYNLIEILIINKFREYIGDRSVVIQSKRLLDEMKVFIWKNSQGDSLEHF